MSEAVEPVLSAAGEEGIGLEADLSPEASSRFSQARRTLALLHTAPLLEHDANKAMRGQQDYDFVTLSLEILDFVTDNMSLQSGVLKGVVEERAIEVCRQMLPGRKRREYERVVKDTLATLLNDGKGALIREVVRADGRREQVEIQLLREGQDADGAFELRATPQAINLFVDAMDFDIESTENAFRAMLDSQLKRGRFGRASQVAAALQKLSRRFQEEVRLDLEAAARDITRVDWSGASMRRIDEAYAHVDRSRQDLGRLIGEIQQMLEEQTDPEARRRLQEVADLVEQSRQVHWDLFKELLGSRHKLRQHHEQQVLAPIASLASVAPDRELLHPVLGLRREQAQSVLDAFSGGLIPPHAELIDLYALVAHLWRTPREREEAERPVEPIELLEMEPELPAYPDRVVARARQLLARPFAGERVSQVLAEIMAEADSALVSELFCVGALFAFGIDEGLRPEEMRQVEALVPADLRATRSGEQFCVGALSGDDLRLSREAR